MSLHNTIMFSTDLKEESKSEKKEHVDIRIRLASPLQAGIRQKIRAQLHFLLLLYFI